MTINLSNSVTRKKGKVILAGAGPGDIDLITIKLYKALQQADVIISDRLVNPTIVETYANKNALLILAGKQGYNEHSISMKDINSLITQYALSGKTVLRLKGGDVAFFSNVLDELQNLVRQNIAYEIIPGITSASGASAYSGIPLTARGYSQGVQFLTHYIEEQFSPEKWKQLASSSDTLVFYMSANHAIQISSNLIHYGSSETKPIAIIEQSTTPYQRTHTTTLGQCHLLFNNKTFSSPSLIIVGQVVQLYDSFNWYNEEKSGTVFNQLHLSQVKC